MSIPTLTWFDLAVVAVVLISTLLALLRGAVREALTIAAWIGAAALGWYAFEPAQGVAKETIATPWIADVAALIVVFVVPLIILKVLAAVVVEQLPRGWFGHLDRALGALFGLLRGGLIVAAGWLGLTLLIAPEQLPPGLTQARLLPYVQDAAALLQRWLPEPAEGEARAAGAAAQVETT
ncbi:MAG TPA: CvpA family protein [Geminicoccaceae bacterium]